MEIFFKSADWNKLPCEKVHLYDDILSFNVLFIIKYYYILSYLFITASHSANLLAKIIPKLRLTLAWKMNVFPVL